MMLLLADFTDMGHPGPLLLSFDSLGREAARAPTRKWRKLGR